MTLNNFKTIAGFALIGTVIGGVLFGFIVDNQYIEELKVASGMVSIGVAKYYHLF